jgi:hypothetical protein
MAKRVDINTPAPEIEKEDYTGRLFQLASLQGKKRVLLIFNRGFM